MMKTWTLVGVSVGVVGGAAAIVLMRRKPTNAASPSVAVVTYPEGAATPSYPATQTQTPPRTTAVVTQSAHSTPYRYTVQSGDTLSSIAARDRTTWEELAALNGLANPNQLTVGETLYLPQPMPSAPGPSGSGSVTASRDYVVSPTNTGTSGGVGSGYGGGGTAGGGSGVDRLTSSML